MKTIKTEYVISLEKICESTRGIYYERLSDLTFHSGETKKSKMLQFEANTCAPGYRTVLTRVKTLKDGSKKYKILKTKDGI